MVRQRQRDRVVKGIAQHERMRDHRAGRLVARVKFRLGAE